MSDWCFTSLSTIFQLYHDGGCLLHETRYALGFQVLPTLMHRAATQDTNTPPSHIILTPGQPVLVLSS